MKQAAGSADKDIFPQDYYNKELVNITADYLQVLTNIQASRK
ncbi:MAG: hypothetical protein ACKPJD_14100 [Planctomycetaceae bacterium]